MGLFHCCCSQWAREQRCARAAGTAGFLPKPWLLQPINRGKSHSPTLSRSLHPAACSCCYFPGRPWPSGHGKGAGDPQVDFPKVLRLCPLCQHRLAALGLSHLPFILGSTGQSPLPLLALGMLPKSQFTLNPPMGFSRLCPVGQVTPEQLLPPPAAPQDPNHVHDTGFSPTPYHQPAAPRALSQPNPKAAPSPQDAARSGPSPGPAAPQSLRVGVPLPGAAWDVAGFWGDEGGSGARPRLGFGVCNPQSCLRIGARHRGPRPGERLQSSVIFSCCFSCCIHGNTITIYIYIIYILLKLHK